jgi:nucleoside-diphosphate-sugar epimerase
VRPFICYFINYYLFIYFYLSILDYFIYFAEQSRTAALGGVEKPPGDEQTELRPVYEYGRSKVEAEKVVREESERLGVDHIILRPTGAHTTRTHATAHA